MGPRGEKSPEEPIAVHVGKTPYVRFDLNDYSVPHDRGGRTPTLLAGQTSVRILDGNEPIALHRRSFDRGAQIEDPAHVQALLHAKRRARVHRAQDRLTINAASVSELFARAAGRGVHMGTLTRGLLALLESHGAAALERAIAAALAQDAAHLGAVRHFIDAHAHADALAPPIAVRLPADPRIAAITVRPHSLRDYEQLARSAHAQDKRSDEQSEHDPQHDPDAGAGA